MTLITLPTYNKVMKHGDSYCEAKLKLSTEHTTECNQPVVASFSVTVISSQENKAQKLSGDSFLFLSMHQLLLVGISRYI